jgi:hypothetical protein
VATDSAGRVWWLLKKRFSDAARFRLRKFEKFTLLERELAGVDVRIWFIADFCCRDTNIPNFLRFWVGCDQGCDIIRKLGVSSGEGMNVRVGGHSSENGAREG